MADTSVCRRSSPRRNVTTTFLLIHLKSDTYEQYRLRTNILVLVVSCRNYKLEIDNCQLCDSDDALYSWIL